MRPETKNRHKTTRDWRLETRDLILKSLVASLWSLVFFSVPVFAAEKNWSGAGDAIDWSDDQNWSPWGIPTPGDDVAINRTNASVALKESFAAHSIALGANRVSTLTVEDFVSGTVAPQSPTDVAILNSRAGNLVLKGSAGTLKLKGQYKDSEQTLADQPSLMFYAE